MDWRPLALLFGATLLVLLLVSLLTIQRLGAWARSRRAKRRAARAGQGEVNAEKLLEEAGYKIIERQLSKYWSVAIDGNSVEFLLRADLLVRRGQQDYIAEVKTGALAPSLANASTRRQLLEYSIAFESPTILLVDVESEQIHEVRFPVDEHRLPASH